MPLAYAMVPDPHAHPLSGPRERLGRAQTHFRELKKEIDRFKDELRLDVVASEREADTDYYALRIKGAVEPPAQWGVIVGDIAHNLRSALDNLMWQLIILNGLDPEELRPKRPLPAFPIFSEYKTATGSGWWNEGRLQAGRVRADHAKILEALQPYHVAMSAKSSLWVLHELNNTDKHRVIQVVGAGTSRPWHHYMFGSKPVGVTYDDIRSKTEWYSGRLLADGEQVGRVHRDIAERKDVKYVPIIDILFGEGCHVVEGMPALETLERIGLHVHDILFRHFGPALDPMPPDWYESDTKETRIGRE